MPRLLVGAHRLVELGGWSLMTQEFPERWPRMSEAQRREWLITYQLGRISALPESQQQWMHGALSMLDDPDPDRIASLISIAIGTEAESRPRASHGHRAPQAVGESPEPGDSPGDRAPAPHPQNTEEPQ